MSSYEKINYNKYHKIISLHLNTCALPESSYLVTASKCLWHNTASKLDICISNLKYQAYEACQVMIKKMLSISQASKSLSEDVYSTWVFIFNTTESFQP